MSYRTMVYTLTQKIQQIIIFVQLYLNVTLVSAWTFLGIKGEVMLEFSCHLAMKMALAVMNFVFASPVRFDI